MLESCGDEPESASRPSVPAALVERDDAHPTLRAKCVELYQEQKILGFLHLYYGEEAMSVGVMDALTQQQEDVVVATYREHG